MTGFVLDPRYLVSEPELLTTGLLPAQRGKGVESEFEPRAPGSWLS